MHKRLLLEAASVKNNSVFSYYVRWQRGTARIRPLHAGRAAIDRYFLQQQTCSSGFTAVDPCWNRQTDGRTPSSYIDPAPRTVWQCQ